MARKKKLINHSPYPDHVIEKIARCLWPDIQADFENYEAQQEFATWKANKERQTWQSHTRHHRFGRGVRYAEDRRHDLGQGGLGKQRLLRQKTAHGRGPGRSRPALPDHDRR